MNGLPDCMNCNGTGNRRWQIGDRRSDCWCVPHARRIRELEAEVLKLADKYAAASEVLSRNAERKH